MRSCPPDPPERPSPPGCSSSPRHGDGLPAAFRPAHVAGPGQEHETESLAGLGRELKPAPAHGVQPSGRLDYHRGETRFTKSRFGRPERRHLVTRPSHHQPARIEAEIGEPGGIERRKGATLDRTPQNRSAQTGAHRHRKGGRGRAGHRMHPPSIQPAAEPTIDLSPVHARPGPFPAPFERSDPGP